MKEVVRTLRVGRNIDWLAPPRLNWLRVPDFLRNTLAWLARKQLRSLPDYVLRPIEDGWTNEEYETELRLFWDIAGNPFRPIQIDPGWLRWNDGAIGRLANIIYDERAFERLPILADALEDAGCSDPHILDHCRGPGSHARGCYVVDMLTGKS
jgi:hypothetical protein